MPRSFLPDSDYTPCARWIGVRRAFFIRTGQHQETRLDPDADACIPPVWLATLSITGEERMSQGCG